MTTRTIAVITAGLSQPSSTRLLADRLADAVTRQLDALGVDAEVSIVELRDTAQDVVNNLMTGFPSPKLEAVIDTVTNADALIAVTPVFTTSYSGLFKSFIDVLDPQSLTDMPVLIGATGGSERHSLALDYAMRPLFTYLHAVVVPTSVYAASSDWGTGGDTAAGALPDRIERAARELATLAKDSDRSSRVVDPFALPAGFSPVGGYGAQ
ncbi:FMN reductase [Conyzicola lurida]|uniref:FMN reductase n=1 Tax=Conyzicola lurida TaxID=1172621 RepID=A0A841AK40_9MICO|nr:FMN reductase [Conyzicola lurida]MBB5842784.1 FMN reductase [Conyzicola lurida]